MFRLGKFLDAIPTKREWLVPAVLTMMGFAGTAYATYNSEDKTLRERIAKVETQQLADGKQLERMETKIDVILAALLERVK